MRLQSGSGCTLSRRSERRIGLAPGWSSPTETSFWSEWWTRLNEWAFSNDYPHQKEYGADNGKDFPEVRAALNGASVSIVRVNDRNEIVVGQRMSIGMSCDHRVIDGAIGAQYLAELRRLIESPTLMLI